MIFFRSQLKVLKSHRCWIRLIETSNEWLFTKWQQPEAYIIARKLSLGDIFIERIGTLKNSFTSTRSPVLMSMMFILPRVSAA